MKELTYIKKNVLNDLSSIKLVEDADFYVTTILNFAKPSVGILYNFINRQEYLLDIFKVLNSENYKLVLLSGFQGTGKTELTKAIITSIENKVLSFNYECSGITNLDDIIIALYGYLHKIFYRNSEFQRSGKPAIAQSIDEKLMNYLKSLKQPLIITIDGFENLLGDSFTIKDSELSKFLNFLLSLDLVKVIITGKRVPSAGFQIQNENIFRVKLGGLDESEAIRILKDHGIDENENTLYQAFQITRGYPESLLWLLTTVNSLDKPLFEIMQEYASRKESFEEFISRKAYNAVPSDYRKFIWFLATIRHPVKLNALHKLGLIQNLEECLEYLTSRMILCANGESYYIKDFLKGIIYASIPIQEKLNIHKYLQELYTEQIPKKLEDRVFRISRKLLHSEQYYHYIFSSNIDKSSKGKKNLSGFISNSASDAHNEHLNSNVLDSGFRGDSLNKDVSSMIEQDNEKKDSLQDKSITDIADIGLDFNIELSEEEKALLQEDGTIPGEIPLVSKKQVEPALQPTGVQSSMPADVRNELIASAKEFEASEKMEQALENYMKANEISEKLLDYHSVATISRSIGNVLHSLHRYEEAIEHFSNSLNMFTKINDSVNASLISLNIANVYNDCYKHETALKYYKKLIDPNVSNIPENIKIEVLVGMGDIYDYRAEFDLALRSYQNALSIADKLDIAEEKCRLCFKIALLYDDLNDCPKAIGFYQRNIEISKDTEINPYLSAAYANLAAVYEEIDNKDAAIDYYKKSLDVDKQLTNYEGQYKTLSRLGNIYFDLGEHEEAFKHFHAELNIARLTEDPYWIAMSFLDIGDFYLSQKSYDKALKAFIMARKSIGKTISTDSREKIDRRFRQIVSEIGDDRFNKIVESIKKKNG